MSPGTLSVWDWAGHQKCVRVVFINWRWWLKLKTAYFTGVFEMSQPCSGILAASRRPDPWLSKKRAILSAPTLFPHTLPKFSFYPKSIFVSENNVTDPAPVSSRVTIGSYTFIVLSFLQRAIEEKENRIWKHLPKCDVWVKTLLFKMTKCRRGWREKFSEHGQTQRWSTKAL